MVRFKCSQTIKSTDQTIGAAVFWRPHSYQRANFFAIPNDPSPRFPYDAYSLSHRPVSGGIALSYVRKVAVWFSCLFVLAGSVNASDEPWPFFRGKDGMGNVHTGHIQHHEEIGLKTAWTQKVGSGYSGIVVGKDVLVTQYTDGTNDLAAAFSVQDGKPLWKAVIGPMYKGHDGSHDGPIATPAIAEGRAFTLSAQGKLYAFDLNSGKQIWVQDFLTDWKAPAIFYGFSSSPVVINGIVVVNVGGKGQTVVGLDAATGEKRWASGDDSISFQSPMIWNPKGTDVILTLSGKFLRALDPQTGKELWKYAHEGSGATGVGSTSPIPVTPDRIFLSHRGDSSKLVSLVKEDGSPGIDNLWENRNIRNSYNVPVYYDGHIYAYSSRFLTCLNAEDGSNVWRSRAPGDGFLIIVDGFLLIQTKAGSVHVALASPEGYEEKASWPGTTRSWTPPAFAHGAIFARNMETISRIDVVQAKTSVAKINKTNVDSNFARFIRDTAKASDKNEKVDAYLKDKRLPIIEGDKVHFVYRSKAKDVALGGDMFGARQERPMEHLSGTDLFYYTMTLPPDVRMSYVFIEDFKNHFTDPGNPQQYKASYVTNEMELNFGGGDLAMSTFAMPQWKASSLLDKEVPATGTLENHELESGSLKRKVSVKVYLPANYDPKKKYSVAYVHGQEALSKGDWHKLLDNFQATEKQSFIAVFTPAANPFNDTGHIKFVGDELVPFIDKTYSTQADREHRVSLGIGMTGAIAIKCVLMNDQIFSKGGANSLFLLDMIATWVLQAASMPKNPNDIELYIDWSSYDWRNDQEAWDMGADTALLYKDLKEKGFQMKGSMYSGGIDWANWRHRGEHLLKGIFGS